jgi:SSS family solute:Na+ symporter
MPELSHLNAVDYSVLVLYMIMVIGVGIYVSRFNKKTSDYFKGGGYIPWGLSMISLFVSGFSAFMFVGASGFTYRNGGAAFILFSLAFPAYMLGYFIYGRLWRRTRIDTPMQFLNRRFSPGTTYFYTILSVIPNVLIIGIMIYMLSIFVSTALGFNQQTFDLGIATVNGFQLVLIVTGSVIAIYTTVGGLWAVMVTDALQFVILFLISLIVLPVALSYLGDGSIISGISRLSTDAPEGYWSISLTDQPTSFWLAYFINVMLGYNVNWHIAQRYYSVPDERDTRKMAMWCAWMSIGLPMLWIIPVMTTPILFPDLATMWPALAEPTEAAFVTLALAVLPHGMLGIMVAAIFAASMSSVDTAFNWIAAVLTKDVFNPISLHFRDKEPAEKVQLWFGKGSVLVLSVLAVFIALSMDKFGGAFQVYLRANSLYSGPMFVPVLLGLVFTRTPWWSGMVAFGGGVFAVFVFSVVANLSLGMPVESFGSIFTDLNIEVLGIEMTRYEINTFVGIIAATLVFFGSAFFHKREGAFKESVESLELDLATPAYAEGAHVDLRGLQSFQLAGRLSLVIGFGLLLLAFPTPWFEGSLLNGVAAVLAFAIGGGTEWAVRRVQSGPSNNA